jgi:homoserine kinase
MSEAFVTVRVPATTANLGPGFDCIGAALTLYNQFQFAQLSAADVSPVIEVRGAEAERVKADASNLAYQAFVRLFQQLQQTPPPVHIVIELGFPLARGLGSSATAIVGGLVGANILAGSPFALAEVVKLAIELEGHPDNVVPALLGGCQLAASNADGSWTICDVPWHGSIVAIVAIPDFELSTAEARRVLPTNYARADAIFNVAHLGLLLRGLATGDASWLRAALHDRIHQPYRQRLIGGYAAVESAAHAAGAYGLVISGAGPTLLALTDQPHASAVTTAMARAWTAEGVKVEVKALQLDLQGAVSQPSD